MQYIATWTFFLEKVNTMRDSLTQFDREARIQMAFMALDARKKRYEDIRRKTDDDENWTHGMKVALISSMLVGAVFVTLWLIGG